jgi:hypothetical protein
MRQKEAKKWMRAIVEESGQAQAVYRSGSGFVIEDSILSLNVFKRSFSMMK